MFIVSSRTSAFNRHLLLWPLRRTSTCEYPTGAPHSAQYCEFVRKCAKSLRQFSPIFFPLTKKLYSQEQFIEEKMIRMMRRFNYSTQKSNAKGQITQVFSVSLLTVFIYLFIYLLLLFVSGVILETYRESWAAALHDKTSWLLAWSGRVPLWGFESTTYPIVQYWKVPRLKNLSNLSPCPSRYQRCSQNMSLPSLTPFLHRALCWEMWCFFFFIIISKNKAPLPAAHQSP